MDSFFSLLATQNKAMGTVAIAKKGEIVYNRSVGFTGFKGKETIAANTETLYRIGSISKTFTATLIMKLVEDKKLSLDTKLSAFYPDIPNANSITITHLLSHSSGLHNITDDSDYAVYYINAKTKNEILNIIKSKQTDFAPGEKSAYSNTNFILLGYIIETITGKTYNSFLSETITDKIKLKHTKVGGKIAVNNNEAASFVKLDNWQLSPDTDMSIPGGAGNIVSTPADLAVFFDALFHNKIISAESVNTMKTIKNGFGFGLFTIPFYSKKAFGHTGGIDGFNSMAAYFPDDELAVAYCSNGRDFSVNDIMIGVLSIYYNMPYTLPSFDNKKLTASVLNNYTGTYASDAIPLKITISISGDKLMAQATGQSAFPLEAKSETVFVFPPAGIEIEFLPATKQMLLKQGGGKFSFTKE